MLLEAVLGIGTDLEFGATLQHIVDTASDLIGARYGMLAVATPGSELLSELFTSGIPDEERENLKRIPDGRAGLLGVLFTDPRPLRLDDLLTDPRSVWHERLRDHEMRRFLGVPIRVDTEIFGSLVLMAKRSGPFTEEDQALLQVLASQAGIAIGNARLYETARQRERWIEGAAAVTTALLTGEGAADALMTVAESARLLADAYAGVVLLPTEEGGMEIVAASTVDDPGDIIGATILPGSPVLVQLLGGEPVFIDDSATDPRMTTHVRTRFGPSMMLPLQSGGQLIGTLALPRERGGRAYSSVERLLAVQFASQAALALVLADTQHNREQLAVYEDRDRIARDLHDLVVQRLFATEMMLESTRRRAAETDLDELLGRAVDELDSTIQEVRTTIFTLQQPPAQVPTSLRGQVLRETGAAGVLLGLRPSVHFTGAVDTLVEGPVGQELLGELRAALADTQRREGVTRVDVNIDTTVRLPDGREGVRLLVTDDRTPAGDGGEGPPGLTTARWQAPR
ncbi:GAF domain-containing protein [Streptomyces sp. 150FB]|uniref:GAF domain-containing sensor histidine kinase n=1 Tax=Streptomyces sp. 150FB TaxID=1576605 RepID=UPI0007C6DBFD|nr:GAF domain-containing protein [Streptomyces sp. 150FB]